MNIAVVGGHKCTKRIYNIAEQAGRMIAQQGWTLVCGGGAGVMEAACKGAKQAKGLTVGILPSFDGKEANKYLDVKITTGLGYARNVLVVRSSQAVIAIDGEYGTLSEIAFAFSAEGESLQPRGGNNPKPIVGIDTWKIKGLKQVSTAKQAINYIKKKLRGKKNA
ncbi:MAG: TIGR00725 family protein [Candidatus Omnitrophica bacterium]|nr:TIGR00725 family protein [Candidatus Omnitrophota bacterium]